MRTLVSAGQSEGDGTRLARGLVVVGGLGRLRVAVANAGRHHAYQSALAAHEAGYLEWFYTAAYWKPGGCVNRFAQAADLAWPGLKAGARLRSRIQSGLPERLVRAAPWFDACMQLSSGLLHSEWGRWQVRSLCLAAFDLVVARALDRGCNLFHGFDGCALYSLQRARQLGAVTILDYPPVHMEFLLSMLRRHSPTLTPDRERVMERSLARKNREMLEADRILVCSDFARRTLVEHGVPADKVVPLPLGVDTEQFKPPRDERKGRSGCTVLFVGMLEPHKGIEYLLEAFKCLELPGVRLVLVGKGGPDWGRIEVRYPGLFTQVENVPHGEIVRHYHEADVFVLPSLADSFGMVVLEAMATGLPVIVSTNVGAPVIDGRTGIVVPVADVGALREALRLLCSDPAVRREMGAEGFRLAQGLGWKTYRQRLAGIYEDATRRRNPSLAE